MAGLRRSWKPRTRGSSCRWCTWSWWSIIPPSPSSKSVPQPAPTLCDAAALTRVCGGQDGKRLGSSLPLPRNLTGCRGGG
eukprot:1660797-Rhodomonas_salina.1